MDSWWIVDGVLFPVWHATLPYIKTQWEMLPSLNCRHILGRHTNLHCPMAWGDHPNWLSQEWMNPSSNWDHHFNVWYWEMGYCEIQVDPHFPLNKAYVREYHHKIWPYMVQYLHFRILKFPLIKHCQWLLKVSLPRHIHSGEVAEPRNLKDCLYKEQQRGITTIAWPKTIKNGHGQQEWNTHTPIIQK